MNYKKMLDDILKILEEKHIDCYFNISKNELNNYIEYALKKYDLKDKYDFFYITNVIIKRIFGIYDSHTKLIWNNAEFNLPIRLKYINGKLYIIRTDEKNKDLLYGEIIKINNIEISQLIEEIKDMTAYSTTEFLARPIETILYNGIKMRSLPSIDSSTTEFQYEILINDKIIKRTLTKQEDKLCNVNKPQDNYVCEVRDGIIYIVYNSCREEYENQMIEFVNKIKELSLTNNIKKYIVDIRGNLGGNSNIINPLIDYLNGKEVITLVDEYVFSGGRFAIFDLKNIGSKFVGTGIATSLNCFGNSPSIIFDEYKLPICNKYFYMDTACELENFRCANSKEEFASLKQNLKYFVPQIFEPDYYVAKTIEDYKNGQDPQFDKALELMTTEKKNKLLI